MTKTGTDTLFEQHTIKEIQEIEKKLRNDIERKKEELRQMVGERYRDLMEAADTITEMKDIAESVTSHISEMENYCVRLKHSSLQHGILQTVKNKVAEKKKKNEVLYSVAAMIKILMDTPTKIWSLIESEDYLNAVLCYLLAQHVHSLFLLDSLYSELGVFKQFPIIYKQWTSIHCFQQILLQKCDNVLQSKNIDAGEIVGPLCCKVLLTDCSSERVFMDMLSVRKEVVLDVFKLDAYAKDQVCDLVKVVQNTLKTVHTVFYSEDRLDKDCKTNLLQITMRKISCKDHPGPVSLFDTHSSPPFRYLPKLVTDFRPILKAENIEASFLQKKCESWIQDVNNSLQVNLEDLLNFVNSIKGLALIREAVFTQLSQVAGFQVVCDDLLGCSFSVWDTFLRPKFVERIKDIIKYKVESASNFCLENIENFFEKASDKSSKIYSEVNVSSYIWTESASDLAHNLGWLPHHQRHLWDGGTLGMKAYGLTPQIQEICQVLNKKLEDVIKDVSCFTLNGQNQEEEWTAEKDHYFITKEEQYMATDLQAIKSHLSEVTENSFILLISNLQSQLESIENNETNQVEIDLRLIFLGHLCHGITRLCPCLIKCLMIGSGDFKSKPLQSSTYTSLKDDHQWQNLKDKFLELSDYAFKIWSKLKTGRNTDDFDSRLEFSSPTGTLHCLLQWDKVEINEESEDGNSVKSILRIPQQVSLPLYNSLFSFCCALDKIGGHALSSKIRCLISEELLSHYLKVYQKKVCSNWPSTAFSSRLIQTQALQVLFDIQFLMHLMKSRDSTNDAIDEISKEIVNKVTSFIDPFDMDVFSTPLQMNLRRALQKSLLLFGMIASPEQVSHLNNIKAPPVSNMEHNVMPMSNISSRFPLLPLAVRASTSIKANIFTNTQSDNFSNQESSLKITRCHSSSPNLSAVDSMTNAMKSSSLYDRVTAMSSSWFGGN